MSNQPAVSIRLAGVSDARLISTLATVSFFEAYFEQDDPHSLADYLIENFAAEKIALELALPEVKSSLFIVTTRQSATQSLANPSRTNRSRQRTRSSFREFIWSNACGEPAWERSLLECCLDEAKSMGKEVLWLGVWEENKRGRSFYAKHGFIEVGTLKFPYGDSYGINRVMQREL